MQYEHHAENYKLALDQQIIPFGLRINKAPAIQTIFEHFNNQWNTILYGSETRLVRLLLEENQKVVEKTRTEFNENLEVSFEKILKSLLGECVLNGTFEMNLQKNFLTNLHLS